jgi:hypothetical protein
VPELALGAEWAEENSFGVSSGSISPVRTAL